VIELGAVVDVGGDGASRRDPLLEQRVEFFGEEMKWHEAAAIGIEQDEVVEALVAIEKDAAVAVEIAHPLGLAQAEILLGDVDYPPVDLDHVNCDIRHGAPEIGGDR